MNSAQSSSIPSDYNLLQLLIQDSESDNEIYRPGPYWRSKTKYVAREIKKCGLDDFRGSTNAIGTSYSDCAEVDVRGQYNYGMRAPFAFFMKRIYPFSRMFDSQVKLTKSHFQGVIAFKNQFANYSIKVKELLGRYRLPEDTLRGGCLDFCDIGGRKIANYYLNLLDVHDVLSKHIDFSSAKSFFEIGGGFGGNLHILIENYKNIRKFVYLDIPPNLYVGTQYLKSFYGNNIKSYAETKNLKTIEFTANNELEVFCIAPHQIENLNVKIDIFQNSCSFVEMPIAIVQNYAKYIERLMNANNSSIALVSYDNFDLSTTFQPDLLPKLFSRSFKLVEDITLFDPSRKFYYYISDVR